MHATILKGIVGGFEFSFFQRNLKELARKAMDICLWVLKESNKSRFDSYSVRNSVLIISHITFRDCRVHNFSDNLSGNSGILIALWHRAQTRDIFQFNQRGQSIVRTHPWLSQKSLTISCGVNNSKSRPTSIATYNDLKCYKPVPDPAWNKYLQQYMQTIGVGVGVLVCCSTLVQDGSFFFGFSYHTASLGVSVFFI